MTNSAIYSRIYGGKSSITKRGGGKMTDFIGLLNEKKQFLLYVFANLITQLGITYYVMMNYGNVSSKNSKQKLQNYELFGIFFIQISIIFVLALVPMSSWIKFILFSIFSALGGISLSSIRDIVDNNIIQMAIFGSMSIFGAMMLFGALLLSMGIQLGTGIVLFLFMSLLFLLIVQVVLLFSATYSIYTKAISVLSLCIFSLYIIYDTNNILQRNYYGDFITASLDYYLDILNIFLDLINLNSR